jgi:hypothetical protein
VIVPRPLNVIACAKFEPDPGGPRTIENPPLWTKAGLLYSKEDGGAHARIRTGDLFLTKEMLYRLSYVGGAAQFQILG